MREGSNGTHAPPGLSAQYDALPVQFATNKGADASSGVSQRKRASGCGGRGDSIVRVVLCGSETEGSFMLLTDSAIKTEHGIDHLFFPLTISNVPDAGHAERAARHTGEPTAASRIAAPS